MPEILEHILKRNGEKQSFDEDRIFKAIEKAFESENINEPDTIQSITNLVSDMVLVAQEERQHLVSVEEVQDFVEQALMVQGLHRVARNYILYRERHTLARQEIVQKKS